MNQGSLSHRELLILVERACDTTLGPDDLKRLEAALRSDPVARQLYQAYALLDADLYWRAVELADVFQWSEHRSAAAGEPEFVSLPSSIEWRSSTVPMVPQFAWEGVAAFDECSGESSCGFCRDCMKVTRETEVRSHSLVGWSKSMYRRSRQTIAKLSSGMAMLVLAGTFLFWAALFVALSPYLRSKQERFPSGNAIAASAEHDNSDPTAHASHAATLVAVSACKWRVEPGGEIPSIGTTFSPTSALTLDSGIAQLAFADGAVVRVEGPARFVVQSPKDGFLEHGRLIARVPQRAIGFRISTPSADVVDLGTKFGVAASKSGAVEVTVLEGKVQVSNPKALADSGGRKSHPRLVLAGEAVTVGSTKNRMTIESTDFKQAVARMRSNDKVIAYQLAKPLEGNQRDFHGGIGLDFDVRTPIRLFSLGVFDHLGDGIEPGTTPVVQLWSRRNPQITASQPETFDDTGDRLLASVTFTSDSPGELKQGHRFKPLAKPIDLPAGSYSIVTYGLSGENPFFTLPRKYDFDFARDPKWTGVKNSSDGNRYGWCKDTSNSGTATGEVGGVFARAQQDSYFGDTQLSEKLSFDRRIFASGTFRVSDISQAWAESDGQSGFFIGHFSMAPEPLYMGLEFENIGDAVGTGFVRVRARIRLPIDGSGAVSRDTTVSASGNHSFHYSYRPELGMNGRLTLHIDGQPPLVADLTDGERIFKAQFDGFGIGATKALNSDSDSAKTAQLFLDDVSYSGRQALAQADAFNADEADTPLKVETLQGSIVPMGTRWGEGNPGTFPKMSVKRPEESVAGSFEFCLQEEIGVK